MIDDPSEQKRHGIWVPAFAGTTLIALHRSFGPDLTFAWPAAAIAVLGIDQATKLWLLFVFDIGRRGAVRIAPFFDLVLAWNVGISFGWFQNDSAVAQIVLTAIKAIAVIVLAIWMARSQTRIATLALGMIIGGAIGNAIDRLAYGAVVDFALFHVQIGEKTLNWYVFNLADAAIVAGVAALL